MILVDKSSESATVLGYLFQDVNTKLNSTSLLLPKGNNLLFSSSQSSRNNCDSLAKLHQLCAFGNIIVATISQKLNQLCAFGNVLWTKIKPAAKLHIGRQTPCKFGLAELYIRRKTTCNFDVEVRLRICEPQTATRMGACKYGQEWPYLKTENRKGPCDGNEKYN